MAPIRCPDHESTRTGRAPRCLGSAAPLRGDDDARGHGACYADAARLRACGTLGGTVGPWVQNAEESKDEGEPCALAPR